MPLCGHAIGLQSSKEAGVRVPPFSPFSIEINGGTEKSIHTCTVLSLTSQRTSETGVIIEPEAESPAQMT